MSRVAIAVLASGRGSNFEAIVRNAEASPAGIKLLISNVPGAAVLERAKELGVPAAIVDHREFRSRREFEERLVAELEPLNIDLICLAGFNRILSPFFVDRFQNRIMNIHPSLLPAFAGLQGIAVHAAALAAGVKVSGCTVHFVTNDLDAGPIIVQRTVPVLDSDTPETLAERVLAEEHKAYPEAIALFCSGRLRVTGRRVTVVD
ncbi:MAG: phosphoribosylglycinamide formyltransferase [candidate division WOR-3 bacterium]